jgi:hypothetical protein
MILTGEDVATLPDTSIATAVRICGPLAASVVSHEAEYGEDVNPGSIPVPSS